MLLMCLLAVPKSAYYKTSYQAVKVDEFCILLYSLCCQA